MRPPLDVTLDYDAYYAFQIAALNLAASVQFLLETKRADALDCLREQLHAQMTALDATRRTARITKYSLPKESADA
jgi:hypothetical protein